MADRRACGVRREPECRGLNNARGFTLIEVMVALAVFSLAALALIRLEGATIRSTALLGDTTLAQMVARNVAVEAITAASPPALGQAANMITLCVLIFLGLVAFIFWLGGLAEKAAHFDSLPEVQDALEAASTPELARTTVDGDEADALKAESEGLDALADRGYYNERLDQLVVDVLLGVR